MNNNGELQDVTANQQLELLLSESIQITHKRPSNPCNRPRTR